MVLPKSVVTWGAPRGDVGCLKKTKIHCLWVEIHSSFPIHNQILDVRVPTYIKIHSDQELGFTTLLSSQREKSNERCTSRSKV